MLVGYFGLTLLHTQKEGATYELNLLTEVFFLDGEVRPSS